MTEQQKTSPCWICQGCLKRFDSEKDGSPLVLDDWRFVCCDCFSKHSLTEKWKLMKNLENKLIPLEQQKPRATVFTTNFAPLKEVMWQQNNLLGEKLEIPVTPEEVKAVCCKRCFNAKRDRCKCKCKGVFHGLVNSSKVKGTIKPLEKGASSVDKAS